MKRCNGCKYLVQTRYFEVCSHSDPEITYEVNPYTGRGQYVRKGYFRPDVREMRSEKGDCGPEAKLYAPTLFRKLLLWISGKGKL